MKRKKPPIRRRPQLSKMASEAPLTSDWKPLPKWEIEGRFEDHPDADKDRLPRWRTR